MIKEYEEKLKSAVDDYPIEGAKSEIETLSSAVLEKISDAEQVEQARRMLKESTVIKELTEHENTYPDSTFQLSKVCAEMQTVLDVMEESFSQNSQESQGD